MIIRRPRLPRLRPIGALLSITTLLTPSLPLEAKNRKGDRMANEARVAESREDWDKAVTLATQCVKTDPGDPAYQLILRRVRFEAGNFHVSRGQQFRKQGKLSEALADFEKAYDIDPSSDIAEQELRRTRQMIDREKKKQDADPNYKPDPAAVALTPSQAAKQEQQQRVDSLLPAPELRTLNAQPITLRMNNQKPRVLFETLGKYAGVNVLFDPDYETASPGKNQSIDLNGTTLNEALDDLAVMTHSFWKPLSANTIFVTTENPTKRREYEDQEVKVFYLSNVTTPQELQEVITTLRQVIEVTKLFQFASQNAVIVRAEPAKMALVEKLIGDLDKPKSEVLVDVMVMEVDSTRTRQLAAAFAPNGISMPVSFTPRASLQTLSSSLGTSSTGSTGFTNNGGTASTGTTGTTGTGTGTTGTTGTSGTTGSSLLIPLGNIQKIDGRDFSITNVPGGLLEAIMTDVGTRVLQRPQLRAVDNIKASLKIGNRVPTASGSYSPGVGGVSVNALVNTQFTYIDTGVEMDITPRVHDNNEVSLHMELNISEVSSYSDLGGIQEPVISQHKATVDLRGRDGQICMLGGLIQLTDTKTVSGIPGLSSIPFLKNLFTSQNTETDKTELLITMVPHILRGPEITTENLQAVDTGNATNYNVRRAPQPMPPGTNVADGPGAMPSPGSAATVPLPANMIPTASVPVSARVSFVPAQLDAQLGSPFMVTIRAEGVTNLQSIESQLKFDPNVLKINAIAAGDLLQQNGLQLQPQRNILNDSGDATVTLARDAAKGSVSGNGGLLTVYFQAIGKGQTVVSLPKTVLRDAAGAATNAGSSPLTVTVK